jgi:hypothetical protein
MAVAQRGAVPARLKTPNGRFCMGNGQSGVLALAIQLVMVHPSRQGKPAVDAQRQASLF